MGQEWRERSSAWFWIHDVPSGTVGVFDDGFATTYPLYKPDYSRKVVYLRPETYAEFIHHLREGEVDWIYGIVSLANPEHSALIGQARRDGILKHIRRGIYAVVRP